MAPGGSGINQMLPPVRLVRVANRIVAEQPHPPRRVTLSDLLEIFGPLLLYAFVLLPIILFPIALALMQPSFRFSMSKVLAAIIALNFLSVAVVIRRSAASVRKGLPAIAEILTATGFRSATTGRLRTQINGREVEIGYASRAIGSLEPGDRVRVLIDPDQPKVLLMLGRIQQS